MSADDYMRPLEELFELRQSWQIGDGHEGPGIYFLFRGDQLLYVGLSKDVNWRLRQHAMNRLDGRGMPFHHWTAIEVPADLLIEVERRYIAEFAPILNRHETQPGLPCRQTP